MATDEYDKPIERLTNVRVVSVVPSIYCAVSSTTDEKVLEGR